MHPKPCKICGAESQEPHKCYGVDSSSLTPPPRPCFLKSQTLRVKRSNGRVYVYTRKIGKDWHKDPNLQGWFEPDNDNKTGYCRFCRINFQPRLGSLRRHGQKYHPEMKGQGVEQDEGTVEQSLEEGDEEVVVEENYDEGGTEPEDLEETNESETVTYILPTPSLRGNILPRRPVTLENPAPSRVKINIEETPQEHLSTYEVEEIDVRSWRQLEVEKQHLAREREEFEREKREFRKQEQIFHGLLKYFNIELP